MSLRLRRRAILRGFMGAAIGLPLLDFTHGDAWAAPNPPPRRFAVFFEHGGTLSNVSKTGARYDGTGTNGSADGWSPLDPGEALVLGLVQQPLAAHRDALLLVRGVDNRAGRLAASTDGDHGWCNVTALTASDGALTGTSSESAKTAEGPSIESVLAARLAARHPVPFPAVHLKVDGYHYGTPFYRAARQPIAGQIDPVAAFDALFGSVTESGSGADPVAARARALKRSVLDGTSSLVKQYQARLGTRDRQTVEAHLDHLRALEQRVAQLAVPMLPGCQKPVVASSFANPEEIAHAHVDVLVAALRCGLTNVGALEIGDLELLWANPPYTSPVGNGHEMHHLSASTGELGAHFGVRQAWIDTMLQNRRWRMSLLARFLDGLAAIPEGAGTMRDNTLALWTSEFSNGGIHSAADVPLLLAGGASGRLTMGRHLNFNVKAQQDPATPEYETSASTHNLFTTILNVFDYPDVHFGNAAAYAPGPLAL